MYREDPRVFGEIYKLDVIKEFFSSKGLNFTNDYENMEIGSIFDGDTTGACTQFDQGSVTTLGDCRLDSPYGKRHKTGIRIQSKLTFAKAVRLSITTANA